MSHVVSNLFGGGAQEKLLKKQQRDLAAAEAGQQALNQGGRGLLAYVGDQATNLGGGLRDLLRSFGGLS